MIENTSVNSNSFFNSILTFSSPSSSRNTSTVEKWFCLSKRSFNESFYNFFDSCQKITIDDWLNHLEKKIIGFEIDSQIYKPINLINTVCDIMEEVSENDKFRRIFVDKLSLAEKNCPNQAMMTLNEIYTDWQIHCKNTRSKKDRFRIFKDAAVTKALRNAIKQVCIKEDTEMCLYCEKYLKDKLNLVSIIESEMNIVSQTNLDNRIFIKLQEEAEKNFLPYFKEIITDTILPIGSIDLSFFLRYLPFALTVFSIEKFVNLKLMNLSNNRLSAVPDEVEEPPNLSHLIISNNYLSLSHSNIAKLTNLSFLDLVNNQLSVLPHEISRLTALSSLLLGQNELLDIPSTFGKLTNLTILKLNDNYLTRLPSEIRNLTNLFELDLSNNLFTVFPEELGSLSSLDNLDISKNRSIQLTRCLGNLRKIRRLNLSETNLWFLPLELGNMNNLFRLCISGNPNLKELPLILGNLPNLSFEHADVKDTGIPEWQVSNIQQTCTRVKQFGLDEQFALFLEKWITLSGHHFDGTQLSTLDNVQKFAIINWLSRLEITEDFRHNNRELSEVVYGILQTVFADNCFRDMFIDQIFANNERCRDRASMAFNEIYTAWQIHISSTMNLEDQLLLLKKAAKTNALRQIIGQKIVGNKEGAEVFLYYETQLKEQLDLLTLMKEMSFEELATGKLDPFLLAEEVEKIYPLHLIQIPAFRNILLKDEGFQEMWSCVKYKFDEKLSQICPESCSSGQYMKDADALLRERESKEHELIYEWLRKKNII